MREDLQRWLDGEIADDAIPDELRPEAERLMALFGTARDVGPAPEWLESRVMRGLPEDRAEGLAGAFRRALQWVVQPREIRVRPVTLGAFAAAVLAVLVLWPAEAPPLGSDAESPARTAAARADDGRVYVQFVYVAPDAGAVTVAGDFNEWSEADFELRDPDGDGVWTGHLPLTPGLHKYMFVVDGEWVTDPLAERHVDDGFGNRNALIDVNQPGSAI